MDDNQEIISSIPRMHYNDLLKLESPGIPPRQYIEPVESAKKSGKWVCKPNCMNVLRLNGQNIPFTQVVFYSVMDISWTSGTGQPVYTVPCPRQDNGGIFPQLKLHSLVFGLGVRGVGCQDRFGIEGKQGEEVWISVNDDLYSDNEGTLVIKVSWK